MHQIFTDTILNETFIKNGFIKLKLLDKKEILEINDSLELHFFNQMPLNEILSVSLWSNNLALKVFADNLIKKFLLEKLNSVLLDYEPIWGDILVKKPHLTKSFGVHQDWTFVDEDQFTSVNVWCPLQDVNYWNGGLQVVPGSHIILDKIRGLNITPSYSAISTEIKEKYAINIEAQMGEAIIFSHALLHASTANRTFRNRVAIGMNLKPKQASLYHYILNKKTNKLEKYAVSNDYFLNIGQQTDFANSIKNGFNDYLVNGQLIKSTEFKIENLTIEEFKKALR